MRQWDLNRDGTIDAGEAEVARAKLRRARSEAVRNEAIDPVTGRPRAAAGATAPAAPGGAGVPPSAAVGRGLPPSPAGRAPAGAPVTDDGGLILVPGTGEPPPSMGPLSADQAPPVLRERDALPGTRVPPVATTIPVVPTPSGLPGGQRARAGLPPTGTDRVPRSGDVSSRARMLPDGSAAPAPPATAGRRTAGTSSPMLPRPGVIAGGPRPPGASSQSLNAGRLPGGLPQTRGVAPGGGPFSPSVPGQPYATQPYGGAAGSRGTAARGQGPPGTAASSPAGGRVPMPPPQSSTFSRPGMRPQVTPPSVPRTQPTTPAVPRPPRVGPEDYFGR